MVKVLCESDLNNQIISRHFFFFKNCKFYPYLEGFSSTTKNARACDNHAGLRRIEILELLLMYQDKETTPGAWEKNGVFFARRGRPPRPSPSPPAPPLSLPLPLLCCPLGRATCAVAIPSGGAGAGAGGFSAPAPRALARSRVGGWPGAGRPPACPRRGAGCAAVGCLQVAGGCARCGGRSGKPPPDGGGFI